MAPKRKLGVPVDEEEEPRFSNTMRKKQANLEKARALRRMASDRKVQERALILQQLPFELEDTPRVHICLSMYDPKIEHRIKPDKTKEKGARNTWSELESRPLKNIPHNGSIASAAIPNPNYKPGTQTPNWAAFRIPECVKREGQEVMRAHVSKCEELKMRHNTSAAHGKEFVQTWLGWWRKYTAEAQLSVHRRTDKPLLDDGLKALLNDLDFYLSAATQRVRQLDVSTYNRMRVSHHGIVRRGLRVAETSEAHERWFKADLSRRQTSSYRNSGLGTMLAISISRGGGTNYHYDNGDDAQTYSVILVLSTPGWLLLPELGYRVQVKPGDVVGFLASQQLHKLELDSANPDATQLVFTLWTDRNANRKANPSTFEDFYVVTPGNGDEVDENEEEGEDDE